jgi:hypothetical protein
LLIIANVCLNKRLQSFLFLLVAPGRFLLQNPCFLFPEGKCSRSTPKNSRQTEEVVFWPGSGNSLSEEFDTKGKISFVGQNY